MLPCLCSAHAHPASCPPICPLARCFLSHPHALCPPARSMRAEVYRRRATKRVKAMPPNTGRDNDRRPARGFELRLLLWLTNGVTNGVTMSALVHLPSNPPSLAPPVLSPSFPLRQFYGWLRLWSFCMSPCGSGSGRSCISCGSSFGPVCIFI